MEASKKCSKCGEPQSLSAFYKQKNSKDGLQYMCITCSKIRSGTYAKNNIKNFAEYSRIWRKKNPEKRKETQRKYYIKNKDKYIKYAKDHIEIVRESNIKWCKNNPEKRRESRIKWCKNNPIRSKEIRACGRRRQTENLTDAYICALIGIGTSEAPKELIEAKRAQIRIKRYLA